MTADRREYIPKAQIFGFRSYKVHVLPQSGVVEFCYRLTGVSLHSIVPDGGALDEALAPVLRGEIDFRSVELEVIADRTRVALHVAMVRRNDATPRGVVVVAHAVPTLSSG